MTLASTSAKGNSRKLQLQTQVQEMWNLWPEDQRQNLQRGSISCILYTSDSNDRPVTRLTTGRPAVQFSVESRDFYLLRNVQTGPLPHPNSYSVDTGALV